MKKRILNTFLSCLLFINLLCLFPESFFSFSVSAIDTGSTDLSKVEIVRTGNNDELGLDVTGIAYTYSERYDEIDVTIDLSSQLWSPNHFVCGYVYGSNDNNNWDKLWSSYSEIGTKNSKHYSTVLYNFAINYGSDYEYCCFDIGYGYALNDNNGLSPEIADANFVSIMKLYIPFSEMKSHTTEVGFIGEVTNNIGTYDVLSDSSLNLSFSEPKVYAPYPTSFDSYEVTSSNSSVAEIVNTYDYTSGTEPLRYVSSEIRTKNEGTANIICKFNNAVVGNEKLKEYTLLYTVNVFKSKNVSLEVWSSTLGEKKISLDFLYSDKLFSEDSTNYNYELSKLSSIMAMSAYWDSNKDNRYAKNNLEKLGFENIYDCESYAKLKNMTESDCHYVGYTFATKDIYIGDQKNTIVAVIIKGTSKNEEWYSNFDVGENNYNIGDRHTGFETAKKRLMNDLIIYLASKDNIVLSKTKFWITGHSRGAGVGNLLAADITDSNLENKNNIYAYLYAPPAGVVMDYSDIAHDNIYNFINPQDFVPRMPLQKWNYSRYGNDYVYPNEVTSKYEYNITLGEFRFKSSEYKKLLINTFYNLFDRHIDQYLMKNGTSSTIKICNDLYSIAPSVDKYYNGGIPPFIPFTYFHDGLATAATGNLGVGVATMLRYVGDSNPFNIPKWININQYFIAGSHEYLNQRVAYSHTPEMYIAWAYVCDSIIDFDYNLFVKGIYACPVDIEVYDSHNNLVGRVVNNKVDESVTILSIIVDEETSTKTVFMPASEQFTVKALGYDNGTMDYSIELCDITDLSTSDLRSVEDIEITSNTVVTTTTDLSGDVSVIAETNDGIQNKVVEYTIDKNNKVTVNSSSTENGDINKPDTNIPPLVYPNNTTVTPVNTSDFETFTVKVENKITGKNQKVRAVRNGYDVTVNIGSENNDFYANIYDVNDDFLTTTLIEHGKAKFSILNNTKFYIIIDEYPHAEDVSSESGIYAFSDEEKTLFFVIFIIVALSSLFVISIKYYIKNIR